MINSPQSDGGPWISHDGRYLFFTSARGGKPDDIYWVETQAFLQNAIQSDLPGGAADQLQERTEGWPAGLRLAALALNNQKGQSGLEDVLQSFSGSHPYVADYLTQEVFKNQPATIQAFLLRTCFLSRMNASLCETVSGLSESAGLLEKLARESLFLVPLEKSGHQTWYRYNPLFAESIQYLARQRLDAAEIAVLFENASAWYENHLDYENAVEAALAARLYPRALTLIEKYIDIHSIAAVLTLKRWFSSIPEQFILAQPEASFTYAQVILFTGDRYAPDMVTRLEPNLNAAEKCWEKENNRARLGAARSLRGITAWWQGDIAKACRLAQQSLDELPETDIFWRGNSLLISAFGDLNSDDIFAAQDTILEARALLGAANNIYGVLAATQILSAADYWLGELEQARQLNNQIIAEAVGSEDMLDDQGIARLSLADISYEENDLSTAEKYLQEALDLAIQRKNELLIAQVTGRLAHLQLARGKPAQAVELIKTQAARLQNPNALREVDIALAEITAHTITPGEAAGLSQEARPRTSNLLFLEQERLTFVQARKLIYTGMNLEALKLLAGRPADAAKHGRIRNQVEALCLEALAYQAAGQPENARAALTQALAVGQAKGFVRLFIDEGAEMANLLKQAIPTFSRRALAMYATTLLQAFPSEVGAVPPGVPGLIEPLSQQELRVLRYLAAGLSNAEIGQELIVSTNTVKTHVKNIYRKLNVSTRGEARQVAHELKLI